MSIIGILFTLFEHRRHVGEPGWPLPTYAGLLVLGVISPALCWLFIRWANRFAYAYLASQEELAQRADETATLNRLSVAASRSLDLQETISTILEQTIAALDANAGMVFIQQDNQPGLRLEAHRGISVNMAYQEAQLAPGHCLCGQAVLTREVLFASDVGDDPRCTSALCICEGFRSVACAPLQVKGQLVGLLQLASAQVSHFTAGHEDFLAAAAAQVSISIENARLYDTVRAFNVELEQKVSQRTGQLEAARWSLAEKARQLQRLLSESYRVQEDTQARIALDMHDGVTQIIIGALYETQAAREALADDPERASESLSHAQQLLSEADTEIRRVIYDLHPPILDMMGLVVALKRFATTFTAAFDIHCQVHVAGEARRFVKDTEIAIYRVIQAALQNVASHAQASTTDVSFDFSPAAFQVIIQDDGVGFDPQKAMSTPGEHLGLIGMKERVEAIGASLDVTSTAGGGTRIKLQLPFPDYV
jgi:signal transduction histidine kinase